MEVTTQYPNASALTTSSEESAARTVHPNASPTQAKVFSESDVSRQFAMRPDDLSVKLHPKASMFPQAGASKAPPDADQTLSRQKRGPVLSALGACAKSEFRECRGGEALKDSASSFVKFDQFSHKETMGDERRGTCYGIVRAAMGDIDNNLARGAATDLLSVVTNMRTDMSSGRATQNGLYDRIEALQRDQNNRLSLRNYSSSSSMNMNPNASVSHEGRIDALIDAVGNVHGLAPGDLALIGVRVQRPGEPALPNGHVLLVQRLPSDVHDPGENSPERHAIFDPNNGVFVYNSLSAMQSALRGYMDSAFAEDGYHAVPDRVSYLRLDGSGSGSQPFTPFSPFRPLLTPPDAPLPTEPPEIAQHNFRGLDEL
ncbi:hypothetical protein [Paraburkholderia haematera]|uniref:Uncharacterized protein n=1 Tax=Paraburkholderia haematera TaxID=2793077 RepID=A0ABN7MMB5_9BURK|nr:hypothetical protein [Paraburkholderia haematera]CAE6816032.1 hypothetical protein R69888_05883 [Paraburkholderia haematera]